MPAFCVPHRLEHRYHRTVGKLILIVLAVICVWWILKRYRKPMPKQGPPPAAEDMVRCAHCGVHLPRSESHTGSGEFFCSEEHLRLRR